MISLTEIWCFTSIHLFVFLLLFMPPNLALEIKCRESERQALLSFKQSLVYRYDILSSWTTQAKANDDCCNWIGVGCSNNITGGDYHITRLDLHNTGLMGEIGSSLTQLSHLTYLDLSSNEFDQIFLEDVASLINLNYLNLSYNMLRGPIPQSLGQLSNLEYLNLQFNFLEGEVSEVHFSKLKNLKALDLSDNLLRLNFNSTWVPPFQLQ